MTFYVNGSFLNYNGVCRLLTSNRFWLQFGMSTFFFFFIVKCIIRSTLFIFTWLLCDRVCCYFATFSATRLRIICVIMAQNVQKLYRYLVNWKTLLKSQLFFFFFFVHLSCNFNLYIPVNVKTNGFNQIY